VSSWFRYDKRRGPLSTDSSPKTARRMGQVVVAGRGTFHLYLDEADGSLWARQAPREAVYGVCCSPAPDLFPGAQTAPGAPPEGAWLSVEQAALKLGTTPGALRSRLRRAGGSYVDLGAAVGRKLGHHWRVRVRSEAPPQRRQEPDPPPRYDDVFYEGLDWLEKNG
jgi:hypothetical protein